jgi:type VI secretion system protein VasI
MIARATCILFGAAAKCRPEARQAVRGVVVAAGMCLVAGAAISQDTDSWADGAAKCKAMSDNLDKNRCLADLMTNSWGTTLSVDKLDGSKSIFVTIASADGMNLEQGVGKAYALSIRCLKNRTELLLSWPAYLGHQAAEVRWRLDRQPVTTERWSTSTSGRTAFAPNPIDLTKKMLGRNEFVAGISAYGKATATTVTFRLAGLDEAIKPLRELCKW